MRGGKKNVLQAFSHYQMGRVWFSVWMGLVGLFFAIHPLFAKLLDSVICSRWLIVSHHQSQSRWFVVVECNMEPKSVPVLFHKNEQTFSPTWLTIHASK